MGQQQPITPAVDWYAIYGTNERIDVKPVACWMSTDSGQVIGLIAKLADAEESEHLTSANSLPDFKRYAHRSEIKSLLNEIDEDDRRRI